MPRRPLEPLMFRRAAAGFTLLELMVVVVLIGIILTFATLSVNVGGRQAELEQEAQRLAALLELAGEEAVVGSRPMGVLVEPDGYRFLTLEEQQWKEFPPDDALRPRKLLPDMELELFIEGLPVSLEPPTEEEKGEEEDVGPTPQLVMFSNGERMPFELVLRVPEERLSYRLVGLPLGPLQLSTPQESGV